MGKHRKWVIKCTCVNHFWMWFILNRMNIEEWERERRREKEKRCESNHISIVWICLGNLMRNTITWMLTRLLRWIINIICDYIKFIGLIISMCYACKTFCYHQGTSDDYFKWIKLLNVHVINAVANSSQKPFNVLFVVKLIKSNNIINVAVSIDFSTNF